ncbi:Uncharacterised protein, partial [Mycoplasmopsis synoviae]
MFLAFSKLKIATKSNINHKAIQEILTRTLAVIKALTASAFW